MRNRWSIGVWALSVLIAVSCWIAALALATPWLALVGTVVAGLVRVMFDIGRIERTAGLHDELTSRTLDAVADAADRHVLSHELWHDDEARRKAWSSIVPGHTFIPYLGWESWTVQSFIEDGEAKLAISTRDTAVWLELGTQLLSARDDFAAAIGPYTADLKPEVRRFTTAILSGLEDAKREAHQVFALTYKKDEHSPDEIAAGGHALFESVRYVYTAAHKLGAGDDA